MSDDYRIEQLEKDVTEVKADIKEIMRNHLPHLVKELTELKSTVRIFGAITLALITGLIGCLVAVLKSLL